MRTKRMTYEEAERRATERLKRWHGHYLPEHQIPSIVGSVLAAIGFTDHTAVEESYSSQERDA